MAMAMAMAVNVLLLSYYVFFLGTTATQLNQSHFINPNSSLSPITVPSSWPSSSGHFAFGFYQHGDGFAVGIWLVSEPENIVVWTANRDDPSLSTNSSLELTANGKFLVRTDHGKEIPIADVVDSANSAKMLDSGNFVLYGKNKSDVIWQSFDFPTDTIVGGQNLTSGSNLISSISKSDHSSGRFLLGVQEDGNLVAYPVNSSHAPENAYWSFSDPLLLNSLIYNRNMGFHFSLDYHGNLSIGDRSFMKKLTNNSRIRDEKVVIYRAVLDPDGIFRLYAHHFANTSNSTMSIEWAGLRDQCDVKGFCSINSYCSSAGTKGDCHCFPGFILINQTAKWSGCSRNFTEDDCREDHKNHYKMTAMENTEWFDYPYSVVPMEKEDCSRSCKEDCDCRAALYSSENCRKFKLPLTYGRTSRNYSSIAFFKVFLGRSEIHSNRTSQAVIVLEGKESLIMILALCLGSIAFFSLVVAVFSFLLYRHQVHSYKKISEYKNLGLSEDFTLRSFSYSELEKATNSFTVELGRGSFGAVYSGTLHEGRKAIAVKRLERVVEEAEREFQAEISTIGRTYHRNLVQLLGFCLEGSKKLLVYEFMKNGSLADILFKAEVRPVWRERVRIALDVARGIFYLHEECEVHIIHCNIKPQNILIDDSGTAKISDFGLAKLLIPNQTSMTQGVSEKKGYSAPEWQMNTLVSSKVDIYSFGIVLLEIICCRSNIEINVATEDEMLLTSWAYDCFMAGEICKLVEEEDVDLETLERMVKVGLWCIQDDPALRPSVKSVILMLEGTMEVQVPPSPT